PAGGSEYRDKRTAFLAGELFTLETDPEMIQILKELKDEANIITQFKNLPDKHKEIEWKTSLIYASLTKDLQSYLKKELQGPIII
ncbi:MAG: hypothetical protein IIY56_06185, partial [Erysipelotrichaceae bacterium]|nr:hypothetical protein [Erysipelotrichaceae bacterium]